jgi:hypothetical protein
MSTVVLASQGHHQVISKNYYTRNFFRGVQQIQLRIEGSGGGSPIVRGSIQFANE